MITKRFFKLFAMCFACVLLLTNCTKPESYEAYLFTYFTGNGPSEEAIHYAVSIDGYNYRALNDNKPIIDSKAISTSGGVRDPHILRRADGKGFYMVVTDLYVTEQGWNNYAMILMKSKDLVTWESSVINIPETYPNEFGGVDRVWAPQVIYDEVQKKYMVYFSMKERGAHPDVIYYAYANKDFTALEAAPEQLYFPKDPKAACIDADIIPYEGKYYMFHKSENGNPGIKLAVSDKVNEGYEAVSEERIDCEKAGVEGSGVFKLNNSNEYILMYDVYTRGRYQFTRSTDLRNFTVIDQEVSMNFHARHGTVMPITKSELERLVSKWGSFDDLLVEPKSEQLKKNNIDIKADAKTIHLPVKQGTDLQHFDPEFKSVFGITFQPQGAQDFTKGAVEYTFSIKDKGSVTYKVTANVDNNPVLNGYYADPDIIYSEKTGKYYIYPTSDGFDGWGGYYFKVFSSDNLVDWTDEGVILDLKKEGEVVWADRNAWAPCIVEKKINGEYKYFYYFTAAQKIGVAVADNPTGPFVDSGKPLLYKHPKGVEHGQEIDPDVFTDPQTGKSYLYWGNGYMAGAELNDDMISIKENTVKIFNIDQTYREGTHIIYRNGQYYAMWSEDDTRSPNYKVRWAKMKSPLSDLEIPENNIVIQRDDVTGIFATGHNSSIQVAGKDEWYLVYHRFTYPNGVKMPDGRGGFHREVCMDKLEFDTEGNILEVKPTFEGISSIK